LGCVDVVDELVRAVVRRAVERVPAALRRAVVRVLRAADLVELAAFRAVVLAVVDAAFAVLEGVEPPELLVVAIDCLTPLQSRSLMVAGSLAMIEHTFVNHHSPSVTFLSEEMS
jgi:hypothetical protein